ncbi:formin-like protein 5 [Iris pallida]|uniref:Formin-like protein 5 n=1 Tax=Iris pallida TaxID=29817 RepID=A0AAX6H9X0_IRIPA|nr:formin-like protein 5 [Iris pallida]
MEKKNKPSPRLPSATLSSTATVRLPQPYSSRPDRRPLCAELTDLWRRIQHCPGAPSVRLCRQHLALRRQAPGRTPAYAAWVRQPPLPPRNDRVIPAGSPFSSLSITAPLSSLPLFPSLTLSLSPTVNSLSLSQGHISF